MFKSAEIVQMAQDLARHSSARHSVIAKNVANADTPGFRAMDVSPFEQVYGRQAAMPMHRSRPSHFPALMPDAALSPQVDARAEMAPNGNSVSLEQEMIRSAEVQRKHGLALAVYKSSLDMMRTALGRGR